MNITNKRTVCDVTHEGTSVKLSGSFTYTENKLITGFSGSFYKKEDSTFVGNFNYTEIDAATIDKSVNSMLMEHEDECMDLIDTVVGLIKAELGK